MRLLHDAFDPPFDPQEETLMSARVAVVGATGAVGREMLDTLSGGTSRWMASA